MAQTTSIKHKGWKWSTADESNPTLVLVVDDTSKAVHIADASDASADWAVSADTYPSLYIHTAGTNVAGDYIKIWHDDTDANIACYNATALNFLIDTTAYLELSTSALYPTSVAGIDLGTTSLGFNDLHLDSGGVINFDGGDITITHSAYNLTILPGTNNAGVLAIGNGTKDIDFKIFMNTAAQYVLFDISSSIVYFEGTLLRMRDSDYLQFGDAADITMAWTGAGFHVAQASLDSTVYWGVNDDGINHVWYGGTSGSTMTWDQSSNRLEFNGALLQLEDNDALQFGDAAEVTFAFDGASTLYILPSVDNGSVLAIGNGTTDMDLKIYMNTSAKYVQFDQSSSIVYFEGTLLRMKDSDALQFGDSADITMAWTGAGFHILQLSADSPIYWGVDGAGMDQRWYGGVSSAYMHWDQSSAILYFKGSSHLILPVLASGTTVQGDIWFDTSDSKIHFYDGSSEQTVTS